MVSWGWIPICLMAGAVAGILLVAWLQAGREDEHTDEQEH